MTVLLKRPDGAEEIETVMSNMDHQIDAVVADQLKSGKYYAQYAGWDFCGYVWWGPEAATYHCEVWRYTIHEETVSGSLQEIMDEICDRYGAR